jgi:hypothetical protein
MQILRKTFSDVFYVSGTVYWTCEVGSNEEWVNVIPVTNELIKWLAK